MYMLETTLSARHSGAYVPAHAVNCAGGLRDPSVPGWWVHSALSIGRVAGQVHRLHSGARSGLNELRSGSGVNSWPATA